MEDSRAKETWHDKTISEVGAHFVTDPVQGLSAVEASSRLARHGPNTLRKAAAISPLALLASQFSSLVIWVLIVAAIVSMALGEIINGLAILTIVVLNAFIGFFQEYRAERAAAALARLTAPRARIIRAGIALDVPAAEVVPGDVLLLDAGDVVAADARLAECAALRANEAPLTGESEPVHKTVDPLPSDLALADRRNMVFLGTSIAGGSGRAVVVATGMDTEVGHIATLLETAESGETPLQRRMDQIGRRLLLICFGIVLLFFLLGLTRGHPLFELFLSAVSLAVAAIPEGLPAVVTIALAFGVQRMIGRNALVRRLQAVETLGCTEVICTDKTGTLTVGEMTARKLIAGKRDYRVSGEGYAVTGTFFSDNVACSAVEDPTLIALLTAAAACNDAHLSEQDHKPTVLGDPTEGALLVVAAKAGVTRAAIDGNLPRLSTLPFDSDRKRMTVVRQREGGPCAYVKGAPEVILERCTRILTSEGIRGLTAEDRVEMGRVCTWLAADALRVLAVAERPLSSWSVETPTEEIEQGLTLLGLIGLQDPPRAEARLAVANCRRAGIKTVMITGDHPDTAQAIARELGILEGPDEVLVGRDLERMSDAELAARVRRIAVYARVTAEHKLRIVRAWKAQGSVVAMTGDGVNDAPALKEAAIGIAMGRTGTEVTKEAADIIITDDNFASIVAAVEEGRGIYDNIVKALGYLLGGNAGELALMLIATLVGWPLPLLPLHLLWINLVTDGLPALALAADPVDPHVLSRPPRSPQAELMDRAFLQRTLWAGVLTALVALVVFAYEYEGNNSLAQARDATFTAVVITRLFLSFWARSTTRTVWQLGVFSNIRLFVVVAVSFALQIAIHHVPFLQTLFAIQPISPGQCLALIALGFIPLAVLETRKMTRQGHGYGPPRGGADAP
jgi:Ca2+-transporting ATPase